MNPSVRSAREHEGLSARRASEDVGTTSGSGETRDHGLQNVKSRATSLERKCVGTRERPVNVGIADRRVDTHAFEPSHPDRQILCTR